LNNLHKLINYKYHILLDTLTHRCLAYAKSWCARNRRIETIGAFFTSTTLEVYGHLYHELQNGAARIVDELVTPIPVELSEMVGKEIS
jgi:hypothetical protein